MSYKKALLLTILITGLLLRLVFLNNVPPGIANDELNIILNAKSLLKTGQNIPGVVTGIIGVPSGDLSGGIHSEISSFLLIPFFLIFGFSLPAVKLPFVVASMGIVYLSYLLIKKLINEEAGIIAAILATVNPWLIFFGRSGYESIFSSLFYLLAIYLVISLKGWKILWSLPFFIFGLLSYFSAKTIFFPLTIISIPAVRFFRPKDSIKPILILNAVILIFLLCYGLLLYRSPAGVRFGELSSQNIKEVVDTKRTAGIDLPFSNIFENKFMEDFSVRIKASLGGLSPTYLFLNGQPESIPSLSIPDHGFLYLIDLPLIIIGLIFLAKFNQKLLLFLLGLITITLIPNFLNLSGTTYTIRTVILFPILVMISSLGIYHIKSSIQKNVFGKTLLIFLGLFYILSVGNFIYQYFGRLPIDKNEGWFLDQRVLAKYVKLLQLENPNTKITIITTQPKQIFYRYLFFSGIYTDSKNIKEINDNLSKKNYALPNLTFTSRCSDLKDQNFVYIIDTQVKCPHPKGNTISSPKDSGDKYVIINDRLCSLMVNRRYPLIKTFNLLNIEDLPKQTFCQNYVTNHDR